MPEPGDICRFPLIGAMLPDAPALVLSPREINAAAHVVITCAVLSWPPVSVATPGACDDQALHVDSTQLRAMSLLTRDVEPLGAIAPEALFAILSRVMQRLRDGDASGPALRLE